MRQNIVGNVISIIVLFIGLIILPSYFIGIIQWRQDMNICQTAARNFVDMVIDDRKITERALSDLNLSIASCTGDYNYEYFREEKIVNPNPETANSYLTTWVHKDVTDDTKWRTGDIVTIVISQKKVNLFQRLATALLGSSWNNIEVRLSGMVR